MAVAGKVPFAVTVECDVGHTTTGVVKVVVVLAALGLVCAWVVVFILPVLLLVVGATACVVVELAYGGRAGVVELAYGGRVAAVVAVVGGVVTVMDELAAFVVVFGFGKMVVDRMMGVHCRHVH